MENCNIFVTKSVDTIRGICYSLNVKGGDSLMDATKIGKKLKKLRGNRTIKEVSSAIGISSSALSMYEQGNRIPRDKIKTKIAKYYHSTVQEIFFTQ